MNALTVTGVSIRQDEQGRYCLNDLHKAAGGAKRHAPNEWLRNKQTQALLEELDREGKARIRALGEPGIPGSPLTSKKDGVFEERGTFIVKELVYAYAMWISPAFHLRVIRAYDALVNGELVKPLLQVESYWFGRYPHWPPIRVEVLAGKAYKAIAEVLQISRGRVARAVKSMIKVGLLDPAKVAEVQRGPARKAAIRYSDGWGGAPSMQMSLDFS
ncbi:MAG TPA: KilA-N domain-containing protein [Desulfuromonadaceae bacterium]